MTQQPGQPDMDETLLAWADIVLRKWQDKIMSFKIWRTGDLFRSLKHEFARNSNGDISKIEFSHLYYGVFTDRGTKFVEQREWFNPVYYSQVMRLKEILQEKYSHLISEDLIFALEGNTGNKGNTRKV